MELLFPQGFRHVEEKGQCCSQCQQVACVANFPFGNVTIEVSAPLLCAQGWIIKKTSAFFQPVSCISRMTSRRCKSLCVSKVSVDVYLAVPCCVHLTGTTMLTITFSGRNGKHVTSISLDMKYQERIWKGWWHGVILLLQRYICCLTSHCYHLKQFRYLALEIQGYSVSKLIQLCCHWFWICWGRKQVTQLL